MTSLAFILGVVPLLLARGAGAEMRWTLGVAVFSGMLGVTLFGIFLTPVFFNVVDRLGSSHVLASPAVRIASGIVLFLLTFGYLWILMRLLIWLIRWPARARLKVPPDETGEESDGETSNP
jgi:multidrug efflux pump